ncbi:MAG: hypothetical protein Q9165_008927, partial [Trypethelium subeluteriae]
HQTNIEPKTDQDSYSNPEVGLPWRYLWGDFVALSYVWGDLSVKAEIYVDNTPVLVTSNLETALRQLRNHSRIKQGFMIWIDALCINQADLEERTCQVALMKDIYASAWHVVVWLGPEADDSDLAMMAMRYLSLRSREREPRLGLYRTFERYIIRTKFFCWKHSHKQLQIRVNVLRAICHLLARPYWRRLWIIQEITLAARQSPVLCGDSCILLEDIHNALQVIQGDASRLGQYIIRCGKGIGISKYVGSSTKGDRYALSENLWERTIAMIDAQSKQEGPAAQNIHSGVFGALLLSREADTSDERDRVYEPFIAHVIFHDQLLTVQGVLFDTIITLSAFHATESNQKYPQNGPCRESVYGSESATKEAFWRTIVANTNYSGQLAPVEYSEVLHPQIWDSDIGIRSPDHKLRGLNDFFYRNKSLKIFNQPLLQLIHGPKKTMRQFIRGLSKTGNNLLIATEIQHEATTRATRILAWRRLVTTKGGYLGIVPAGTVAHDTIAVLRGCDMPLVLRPLRGDTRQFSVIGECYVHGIMSGEVQEFLQQGK